MYKIYVREKNNIQIGKKEHLRIWIETQNVLNGGGFTK